MNKFYLKGKGRNYSLLSYIVSRKAKCVRSYGVFVNVNTYVNTQMMAIFENYVEEDLMKVVEKKRAVRTRSWVLARGYIYIVKILARQNIKTFMKGDHWQRIQHRCYVTNRHLYSRCRSEYICYILSFLQEPEEPFHWKRHLCSSMKYIVCLYRYPNYHFVYNILS